MLWQCNTLQDTCLFCHMFLHHQELLAHMWIPNPSGEQPALSQFHMKYSKEQCLSCFLFSSSLQPATSSPSASPGRCWGTKPSACSKSHTSASVRSVHLACHFRSYQRRWKRWHACRHALTSPTSAGVTSAAGHGAHTGQGTRPGPCTGTQRLDLGWARAGPGQLG